MEKALTGLVSWIDARLPVTRAWDTHMGKYYAPKNFNLWYFFGVFSLLVLVNQLLTGIWLTMSYTPALKKRLRLLNTSCVMSNTAGCCGTCTRPVLPPSSSSCICTCSAP